MNVANQVEPIETLLVEDNPGDIALMRRMLQQCGAACRVTVARSGSEALDILWRRGAHVHAPRPDLVLLDLNLPVISGLEVLAEMKSQPRLQRIPVIVISSSKLDEDVARSYDLHANCFISKPISLDELRRVVHAIETFWFQTARFCHRGVPAASP